MTFGKSQAQISYLSGSRFLRRAGAVFFTEYSLFERHFIMKRILILLPLVVGLAVHAAAFSVSAAPTAVEVSELPWSTVSAVLKKVSEHHDYSYSELVDWYQVGLVTVRARSSSEGGGYEVRVYDADGIVQVLVIDEL